MSELNLRQIERIDRYKLSRRRPERTPLQNWLRFQVVLILSFLGLILGALLLIKLEWSPGNQAAIATEYREYRAQRHEAVEWR